MRIPSSSRAGKISFPSMRRCSAKKSCVWSWTRESCSSGVIPSGTGFGSSEATCCCNPETRIMKNSSRLVSEIETNRTLSNKGCRSSRACARTRSLKASHESSRFMYRDGSERLGLRATSVKSPPPVLANYCTTNDTTPPRAKWYIATSWESFSFVWIGARSARVGTRTGGDHLQEESEEGPEEARGGERRPRDAASDGTRGEGAGLRRPRSILRGWRLQETRLEGCPQGAKER